MGMNRDIYSRFEKVIKSTDGLSQNKQIIFSAIQLGVKQCRMFDNDFDLFKHAQEIHTKTKNGHISAKDFSYLQWLRLESISIALHKFEESIIFRNAARKAALSITERKSINDRLNSVAAKLELGQAHHEILANDPTLLQDIAKKDPNLVDYLRFILDPTSVSYLSSANSDFVNIIKGKRVAVVAPGNMDEFSRTTEHDFDVVVAMNELNSNYIDVNYINEATCRKIISSYLMPSGSCLVFKSKTSMNAYLQNKQERDHAKQQVPVCKNILHYMPCVTQLLFGYAGVEKQNVTIYGLNAMPNIIFDLLFHGARHVYVFNSDLMLSRERKAGYYESAYGEARSREMESLKWGIRHFAAIHNPLAQFNFLRLMQRTQKVTFGPGLQKALALGETGYLRQLGKTYTPLPN